MEVRVDLREAKKLNRFEILCILHPFKIRADWLAVSRIASRRSLCYLKLTIIVVIVVYFSFEERVIVSIPAYKCIKTARGRRHLRRNRSAQA